MDKNRNKKGPFKQMLEELKEGEISGFAGLGLSDVFH